MPEQDGHRCIVTGAGRGLGRAMAFGLLRAGHTVALLDLDCDALAESVALTRTAAPEGRAHPVCGDIADPDDVARMVNAASDLMGGVDVLVNNAGVGPEIVRPDYREAPIRLWEIPVEAWHRAFAINAHAHFYAVRRVVPAMLERGWGRIVNVTTSLERMMKPGYGPYGCTKAAAESATAILAGDLAGTGVTANVLTPGMPADTRLIPAEVFSDRTTLMAPERMVPPLLWLLSEAADRFTGMRIEADLWDPALPAGRARAGASAPAAWPAAASPPRIPAGAAGLSTPTFPAPQDGGDPRERER